MSTGSRTPFDGQRVAIFEARMAGALADLVARQGGRSGRGAGASGNPD